MDWSKAKTILIIALVIADIVLVGMYIANKDTAENEDTEAILTMLGENNINVDAPIPKTKGDMAAVSVMRKEADEAAAASVTYSIQKEKDKKDANAYRLAAKEYTELIGMKSDYAVVTNVDKINDSEYSVTFACVVDGYTLDGSYMIVSFEDGTVTGFEENWFEPVGRSENTGETISGRAALLSYMADRESSEEVTVKDIEMVYWIDENLYQGEGTISDTALPAWKLTVSEGSETDGDKTYDVHINAYKRK